MPQSLSNCLIHAIWSTKDRFPFLTDRAVQDEFHSVIGGISARLGCPTLIVGGVEDHVHILMQLARTISIADWVKETKRASTVWMQERCEKAAKTVHRATTANRRLDNPSKMLDQSQVLRAQQAVLRGDQASQWNYPLLAKFKWQGGYADFSVSEFNVAAVRRYIANQERHHKTMSFQDEYRKFLTSNNMEWDERFVWD